MFVFFGVPQNPMRMRYALPRWRNPTACEVKPVYFNATKDKLRSGRLSMEPFAEKPADNLTSIFILYPVEANRGMSGGTSHNSIDDYAKDGEPREVTMSLCVL